MVGRQILYVLSLLSTVLTAIGWLYDRRKVTLLGWLLRLTFPALLGILPGALVAYFFGTAIEDEQLRTLLEFLMALGIVAGIFNGLFYGASPVPSNGRVRLLRLLVRGLVGLLVGIATGVFTAALFGDTLTDALTLAGNTGPVSFIAGAAWPYIEWHTPLGAATSPRLRWPERVHSAWFDMLVLGLSAGVVDELVDVDFAHQILRCDAVDVGCLSRVVDVPVALLLITVSAVLYGVGAVFIWFIVCAFADLQDAFRSRLAARPLAEPLLAGLACAGYVGAALTLLNDLQVLPLTRSIVAAACGCAFVAAGLFWLSIQPRVRRTTSTAATPAYSLADAVNTVVTFVLILALYTLVTNIVPPLAQGPSDTVPAAYEIRVYLAAVVVCGAPVALVVGGFSRHLFEWSDKNNKSTGLPAVFSAIFWGVDALSLMPQGPL